MDSVSEPLLSVILPTYNERENIVLLVPRILDVLWDVPCEVIVVDDSSADGTADAVREMAASDARVRLVERPGEGGAGQRRVRRDAGGQGTVRRDHGR